MPLSDRPKGIYLPDGTFHRFDAETLSTEFATRQTAGLDFSEGAGWLSLFPDPDPILRRRNDDAAILQELLADDQVTTAVLGRKNRVLNAPHYGYRPGAPDGQKATPEATQLYERLTKDLERTNLRSLISGILDAPLYGMVPIEIIWRAEGDWWHIVDLIPRPYHWFGFSQKNELVFKGGRYGTEPRRAPPEKIVLTQHHATYDNPYGLRLLSRCLWPVAFKRGGLQFYAKFVERFGLPWVIGKAPPRAQRADKAQMAADLARMVRDCIAALPAGSDVQLLSPGSGQAAVHEPFLSRQDKAISKIIMGQTLTVEMDGKNNSQAAATTHTDTAEGIALADRSMVVDTMGEIAWLYANANMGADVLAPIFAYEEPKNLSERADLDKKLYDMGVDFKPQHFIDNYNLQEGEFEIRKAPADAPPIGFASGPGESRFFNVNDFKPPVLAEEAQRRLDAAIDKMLPEALKANSVFITKLENTINAAKSFDELQLALVGLLAPEVTPSELEDFLARTMTAAAGFGAAAVEGEAREDE